ncbi:hypothetical protein ABWH96_04450 [Marivirga tractuosa]|uniref:hypothetical protein n=1 Tax=Marivirga tractuosa TaxID=1006 RepID=UPI0035D12A6C
MKNLRNENQKSEEIFELAKQFEVEELEERVEFGKWTASAEGGYSQEKGAYVGGKLSTTFGE